MVLHRCCCVCLSVVSLLYSCPLCVLTCFVIKIRIKGKQMFNASYIACFFRWSVVSMAVFFFVFFFFCFFFFFFLFCFFA